MLVKRVNNGYEFESPTVNGAFIVKLTLTDKGEEKLETLPIGVPVTFTPRDLDKGTIKKAIGDERWKNFEKMKKDGISTMFIDPHKSGFIPHVW
ncbi:MAG: hypothetical protein MJB14_16030 [Spirochaetes bacterium]|nr:hypothetical protein [Spirochaetota bacterium]